MKKSRSTTRLRRLTTGLVAAGVASVLLVGAAEAQYPLPPPETDVAGVAAEVDSPSVAETETEVLGVTEVADGSTLPRTGADLNLLVLVSGLALVTGAGALGVSALVRRSPTQT